MQTTVVVLAAGQGRRMGADINKIFLDLGGKPVLAHSLLLFERIEAVNQIIVVAAAGEIPQVQRLVEEYGISKAGIVVEGGSTRLRSVAAALPYISCKSDLVAVHDGARPLLEEADLRAVLRAAAAPDVSGAILAAPVTDTIKTVCPREDAAGSVAGIVDGTLQRDRLWRAMTPQVFAIEPFIEAYSALNKDFTDDAALLEAGGAAVAVVRGSERNLKITTAFDLRLAELILKERVEQ